jgi:hypothetical protein
MCPALLRLFPQVCDRIVIRRIRRQRMRRDTLAMGREKLLGGLAGVRACPLVDQKQMLAGLAHEHLQKRLGTLRVESPFDALREQTAAEIITGTIHLVALTLATGFDFGLPTPSRPARASGAPRRATRFIFEQNHALAAFGGSQNRRPLVAQPGLTLGLIEMVGDKTGFLKGKPQVRQQRADLVAMVEHAKRAPNPHPDNHRSPTRRLKANHSWPGIQQCR